MFVCVHMHFCLCMCRPENNHGCHFPGSHTPWYLRQDLYHWLGAHPVWRTRWSVSSRGSPSSLYLLGAEIPRPSHYFWFCYVASRIKCQSANCKAIPSLTELTASLTPFSLWIWLIHLLWLKNVIMSKTVPALWKTNISSSLNFFATKYVWFLV